MFCENCGAKAKEGANYCEECGTPLKKPKAKKVTNKLKKVVKKPKKEISKKTKIIIGIIIAIIVILAVSIFAASTSVKPDKIVSEYFEAIKNNDVDKLYSYLDVPDKDFTSKEVFEKLIKNDDKIISYAVTNTIVSTDGLAARVTVKYVTEDSKSDIVTINLVKDSGNKMLFFSTWKIENDTELTNDYQIKVMKNAKVELAGVSLTKEYLDEKESDDEFDVYEIPELFKMDYPVKVTYPMGITTNSTINPDSFFGSETLDFTLDDISDEDQTKIEKAVLENIQYIYDNALADKGYSDINEKFAKNDDLEETYNDFKDNLAKRADNLKSITFTKVTLNRVNINDDGYLNVSFKVSYDYETESKKDDRSVYSTITFAYDKEYQVVDFENFKTYF